MTYRPKGEDDRRWIERFPHLERALSDKPGSSILFGELVASKHKDDLDYVGKILRAKTEQALETQQEQGQLWFMIWDVAWAMGQEFIGHVKFAERLSVIKDFVGGQVIGPQVETGMTKDKALRIAKDEGFEGWVVADPEDDYGDCLSFSGKPNRPKCCCKLKPVYENDFILRWDPDNDIGTWGKGKKMGGVGSFFAYLLDDQGQEVFVSKVGGGLTKEQVFEFAATSLWPQVAEVQFTSITKDGSLEFPVFKRLRPDKALGECLLSSQPQSAVR
jgi:ATP-dependent DNA ligase